jgi:AcrR family transcriptional regulator
MVQQRLLDVAVEAFGRHGLEGASTRNIAKAAGTAMSSITYHYGGKEGLYLAAASHVAEQMMEVIPVRLRDEIVAGQDARRAREVVREGMRIFADRLQDPRSDGWSLFIMREQMNPTEAFERIYNGPLGHTVNNMVDLVRVATGRDDLTAARLIVISLIGQVLVLKAARATCRKLLECDALGPDLLANYADRLVINVDAILDRAGADKG